MLLLLYVSIQVVIVCHRYCMFLSLYVIVIYYILYGQSLYVAMELLDERNGS